METGFGLVLVGFGLVLVGLVEAYDSSRVPLASKESGRRSKGSSGGCERGCRLAHYGSMCAVRAASCQALKVFLTPHHLVPTSTDLRQVPIVSLARVNVDSRSLLLFCIASVSTPSVPGVENRR